MSFRLLAVLLCAALPVIAAAPADAATKRCKVGRYGLVDPSGSPAITKLRAVNLPRRTDGYAPRCLVAEAAASQIQYGVMDTGTPPASVTLMGARWYGGKWRCSYAGADATCRKAGKPKRRIRMTLGA